MSRFEEKVIAYYWRNKLKEKNTISFDHSIADDQDTFQVSAELSDYWNKVTGGKETAAFAIFLGLYTALIDRFFSGQDLVLFRANWFQKGQPYLFQFHRGQEKSLRDVLNHAKSEIQQVYKHANLSEEQLLENLRQDSLQNYSPYALLYNHPVNNGNSPFCLHINHHDHSITLRLDYKRSFVAPEVAGQFIRAFLRLIHNLEDTLPLTVNQVPLLTFEEQNALFTRFSQSSTFSEVKKKATLISLFEEQVDRTPGHTALLCGQATLTYRQLNQASNQLAAYLADHHHISKGDLVGVKLERSEKIIVSFLAILKLGAAYVPLDIEYPQSRIDYIEEDSASKLLISAEVYSRFELEAQKYTSENPAIAASPEDLAYLIYTSGSTGKPKGVMITHHNAAMFIQWAWTEFDPDSFNIVYALTSHCFDLSIYEMFYSLSVGATIRVLKNALQIPEFLAGDEPILLNTVPSVVRKLLEDKDIDLRKVSVLNLAGEPFPADIAHRLYDLIPQVRNLYGPSEDTTYSTCYRIENKRYANVPVGKPITNTRAYILDEGQNPVPPGITGTLYLAGDNVAKGYLNREELTAEKFTVDPFVAGSRMYNTGDLAQWLPDGNIKFLGRKDSQIKLRGYRIELGEIDNAITAFSEKIKQAVVDVVINNDDQVLVAYIVLHQEQEVNESALRSSLSDNLPGYMVPNIFVTVEEIPLTPNGKIDRKALSAIAELKAKSKERVAPRNELEQALYNIWVEVLRKTEIGVEDNFFELGGHSLKVTLLVNKIKEDLGLRLSMREMFDYPTIASLATILKKIDSFSITPVPPQESYAVTPSQRRLWVLSQVKEGNISYNMPGAFILKGYVALGTIREVYRNLIARHESLRTSFRENSRGELRQYIAEPDDLTLSIESHDLTRSENQPVAISGVLETVYSHAFDLSQAPLFRLSIAKLSNEAYLLVFNIHHIISDGWSMEILTREFMSLYQSKMDGKEVMLPELAIQYKDYAEWLLDPQQIKGLAESEKYWINQFSGHLPVLELPAYRQRPQVKTYNGASYTHQYDQKFTTKLHDFARQNKVSLFMLLMSGINALFSKYTGAKDIILGTPVADRDRAELENQVGLYLNTLAIRTRFSRKASFSNLLAQQKSTLLDAYAHQSYSFDMLVDKLNLQRDTSRSALFDVMVVLQNQQGLFGVNTLTASGLDLTPYTDQERNVSHFDINLIFSEEEEGLHLHVNFNTDIYEVAFARQMVCHLRRFLSYAIEFPEEQIDRIPILSQEEEQQLLYKFNETASAYPQHSTIIDLFSEQVEKAPGHTALVMEERECTYNELDKLSNQLANYLLANYDISLEDHIAVKLPRSEWVVISFLAILKTGTAYVPIDPDYPASRIDYIEKNSACKLTIDQGLLDAFNTQIDSRSVRPNVTLSPSSLAYVMYTSGSTGQPKGILIEQQAIVRLVRNTNYADITVSDRLLGLSSFAFDGATFDIYGPLLNGGTLVVAPRALLLDAHKLAETISRQRITGFFITTALFNNLAVTDHCFPHLEFVLFGGESTSVRHVKQFLQTHPHVSLHNVYGPTENTTFSTYYPITGNVEDISVVPIGSAIANSTCYILDRNAGLQPLGVTGEIYLGGDGLARSYFNQPELTAEKFVPHPYKAGERLYRSGDLGRWLPGGHIEFMGRVDNQVKIRGHRIELNEIEHTLCTQPGVKQAVVIVHKEQAEASLAAYIVMVGTLDKAVLKDGLSASLPTYMVPSYFVALDTLPVTTNGKIDKKALPPLSTDDLVARQYVAPRNDTEAKLAELWQDILGIEKVGITDNFFELGGHSLKVTLLINKVRQSLQMELDVKEVFQHPSIAAVSDKLVDSSGEAIPQALPQDSYTVTSSQRRLWVLSQFEEANISYNIPGAFELSGKADTDKLQEAYRHLIARHESLRTSFFENAEGNLRQRITPSEEVSAEVQVHDLNTSDIRRLEVAELLDHFYHHAFDLSKVPLFRMSLLRLEAERYLLLFNIHHIISDGWSVEVLIREFLAMYTALVGDNELNLPTLQVHYKDYAEWLQSEEQQKKLNTSENYWLEQFSGDLPVLELPAFRKRPQIKTYNGASYTHQYSASFSHQLHQFSKSHEVSLFMLLMSGINGLFGRYTNSGDIILGTPVAGRDRQELENQVGLYLNTLAIRTRFDHHTNFSQLLQVQKDTLLNGYAHQQYSFDTLVEKLDLQRDTSRSALFDVMVVLQNQQGLFGVTQMEAGETKVRPYTAHQPASSHFDMTLAFTESDGQLDLHLEYNTDIYEAAFVERLANHLENFLTSAMASPEQAIGRIPYLTEAEEEQLLHAFNQTIHAYAGQKTALDLVAEQVEKNPEAIAIRIEDRVLTYREVDEQSNRLAHYLLDEYNLLSQNLVAVKVERSEWLIISLLAVWKAGAAYVPIDPAYPESRIAYMEEDSQCKLTVDQELLTSFREKAELPDTLPSVSAIPEPIAYVLYTSGSTGRPKGVMIRHSSVTALLHWARNEFEGADAQTIYAVTSHCFDLSVFEMFYPLSTGRSLRILNNGLSIPEYLAEDSRILINTVPSVLHNLLETGLNTENIVAINLAGEPFPIGIANQFKHSDIEIRNLYGPSEDTTYSTTYLLQGSYHSAVPIGHPISNTQAYILDSNLALQPIGVSGELYLSGDGLAHGYLNRDELTVEKFIDHPFRAGERLYRTGDLARWQPNGEIEFMGRIDDQVKVRGHRIELGEIEHALSEQAGVKQAVVTVHKEATGATLVAYLLTTEPVDKAELKATLAAELPSYMVPAYYVELEKVPMTTSGKVDKKALPGVSAEDLVVREFVAARNETEEGLIKLWEQVLGVGDIGITDNFFELGGHSLHITRMLYEINESFDIKLEIKTCLLLKIYLP